MGSAGERVRRVGPVLAAGLAALLLFVLLVPGVYSELLANIERVRALRGLELPGYEHSLDEAAWDSGWRSLCSPEGAAATVPGSLSERALEFSALASLDRGDYASAKALLGRLVDQGLAGDEPNALAYLAALEMDWIGAAQAYQPLGTPRHERWWGTMFYLAAQQLVFEGELDRAADLYRRADAAYGVRGPYLGLGLVACLVERGRTLEAWDAYRRALVVMPPAEALAHLSRFGELRLEGLRAWHDLDPENGQVERWLAIYEDQAGEGIARSEVLAEEPVPQVALEQDLGDGRTLTGFDYRVEDLETGPFMAIDFYVRDGEGERPSFRRVRQTVLNQAPNGAFAWDKVPDGVRPGGWHAFLYSHDLSAIQYPDLLPEGRWLCMNGGAIGEPFGLESTLAVVPGGAQAYIQGGDAYMGDEGSLAHGRRWFGVDGPTNPYSYLIGSHLPDEVQTMVGFWIPQAGVENVAVWLFSDQVGRGCSRNNYLFSVPDFE